MLKHIIIVVGSFRKKSFNKQLANYIYKQIEEKATVSFLDFEEIPFMNQDLEKTMPLEIENLKKQVFASDALWFVTPEYNYSYPGLLKNLLDWLSRPFIPNEFSSGTALQKKKVTISGAAGKSGAKGSMDKLNQLLSALGCNVMKDSQVGISLSPKAFETDVLILSESDKENLNKQVEKFLDFIHQTE